jgi:hypothetical protein
MIATYREGHDSTVGDEWAEAVPVLDHFTSVADLSRYAAIPDDWRIGISDVVGSTQAIKAGRYKAVNLAGAASISAVANALGGDLPLFVFGGDGARFAVSPAQAPAAAEALARVAMWAGRDLDLDLRVGMTGVAEARAAGFDARVAFWQASDDVRYAMFAGGAMEWADGQLKNGAMGLAPAAAGEEPDLTGLSCHWGPLLPTQGKIVSLIVKPVPGASQQRFGDIASDVLAVLGDAAALNPVPADGPDVGWLSASIAFQSGISHKGRRGWWWCLPVLMRTVLIWLVFTLGIRMGRFDPGRYRREMAANTDYRKFDDGLMMTVDCSMDTAQRLEKILDEAAAEGVVRYGLHLQDQALITCVVPSAVNPDHVHFVDGAGGGYASAARQLGGARGEAEENPAQPE